jgi:hypothetical protein
MKMKTIATIYLLFFSSNIFAAMNNGSLNIVIEGAENEVLVLLNESMNRDFSKGVTTKSNDSIGYVSKFDGFFSGNTTIKANLVPVTKGNSLKPIAYAIDFSWYASRKDPKGYVEDLIKTLRKVSSNRASLNLYDDISQFVTMGDQTNRCIDTLAIDPEFSLIKDKVYLGNQDPSFEILSNDNYPTSEELDVIYTYAIKRNVCLGAIRSLDKYAFNDPTFILIKSIIDISEQNLLALYKGHLTYAKYAQVRQDNSNKLRESLRNIQEQLRAQDQASKEKAMMFALEQQKLFIEQQKVYAQQFRTIINNIPIRQMPSTTNCIFTGMTVTCNTN